jgi:hypothetical protein
MLLISFPTSLIKLAFTNFSKKDTHVVFIYYKATILFFKYRENKGKL